MLSKSIQLFKQLKKKTEKNSYSGDLQKFLNLTVMEMRM